MCFSASASFTVSAVLMVGGVVALKKTTASSQIPFAAIPILFGAQQFMEGIVWLSLTNSNYSEYNYSSTFIYLVFAQVIWPALVPISIYLLEKNNTRKKIMLPIIFLGLLVGSYLAYCLFVFSPNSLIGDNHISYNLGFKHKEFMYSGVFYLIPTLLPALISTVKKMIFFGLTVFLSFVVSKLFFEDYVISVWCFFAAALSIIIVLIIDGLKKFEKIKIEVI